MVNVSNSSTSHKPDSITIASTGTDPHSWRAWWSAEAEAGGTNWRGLIGLHFDVCNRLQAAQVSS
jgi:hypothetical protein